MVLVVAIVMVRLLKPLAVQGAPEWEQLETMVHLLPAARHVGSEGWAAQSLCGPQILAGACLSFQGLI